MVARDGKRLKVLKVHSRQGVPLPRARRCPANPRMIHRVLEPARTSATMGGHQQCLRSAFEKRAGPMTIANLLAFFCRFMYKDTRAPARFLRCAH